MAQCLKRLKSLHGFSFIHSLLRPSLKNISQLEKILKARSPEGLGYLKQNQWLVYFMELIQAATDKAFADILACFHFSREERECLQQSRWLGPVFKKLSKPQLSPSQIYVLLRPYARVAVQYFYFKASVSPVRQRFYDYLRDYSMTQLDITGDDLKKMGLAEGEEIGDVLEKVLYQKIDGKVPMVQDQLKSARNFFKKE